MHVLDLIGTSGITRVLLVCICQKGAYPRGHPTPLAPTGRIRMASDIWAFFRKSVEKIQVS